ncbi:hypothetical protein GCM10027063_14950 [Promicromonospora xylanilytica]
MASDAGATATPPATKPTMAVRTTSILTRLVRTLFFGDTFWDTFSDTLISLSVGNTG